MVGRDEVIWALKIRGSSPAQGDNKNKPRGGKMLFSLFFNKFKNHPLPPKCSN